MERAEFLAAMIAELEAQKITTGSEPLVSLAPPAAADAAAVARLLGFDFPDLTSADADTLSAAVRRLLASGEATQAQWQSRGEAAARTTTLPLPFGLQGFRQNCGWIQQEKKRSD